MYHNEKSFRQHEGVGRSYPIPGVACLSGLCTGTLSAAAISCSKNIAELLPVACKTVSVAFRAGLRAWEVGKSLDKSPGPWSMVISSNAPAEVIERLENFSRLRVSQTRCGCAKKNLTLCRTCLQQPSLILAQV